MGTILTKITRQDTSNDSMLVDETQSTILHPYDVQDSPMASSDDFLSPTASYRLLPDGTRRISGGHREKQCPTCHKWIDLGLAETGEVGLTNHDGKTQCLSTVRENRLEDERRAANVALDDLRQSASLTPQTPYQPNRFPSLLCSPISPFSFGSGNLPLT